jgi:hypothetical protein
MAFSRRTYHPIERPEDAADNQGVAALRSDTSPEAFACWQRETRLALAHAIGPPVRTDAVPLRGEIVEVHACDDYLREKIVYDVEEGLATVAWLCRPARSMSVPLPAILCCHGPGPGKNPLVGLMNDGSPCAEYHKHMAIRLAQQGYVTLCPDQRGYGECSSFPGGYPTDAELARLDAHYLRTHGRSLLNLNVLDAFRAVDYLCSRPEVDSRKIACFGIADSAPIAAILTALDPRIIATILGCFISDQPGLPGVSTLPALAFSRLDLCALITPRPLQVQIPDACGFVPAGHAVPGAEHLDALYRLCGGESHLHIDRFDGVVEIDFPGITRMLASYCSTG